MLRWSFDPQREGSHSVDRAPIAHCRRYECPSGVHDGAPLKAGYSD
jgi:hypothetical protein